MAEEMMYGHATPGDVQASHQGDGASTAYTTGRCYSNSSIGSDLATDQHLLYFHMKVGSRSAYVLRAIFSGVCTRLLYKGQKNENTEFTVAEKKDLKLFQS